MKCIVVVGDGMADYPLEELGGRTPLEEADTPNLDHVASRGICGLVRTIPEGMPPGSDIANLSIMGYDPLKVYTGRAPLEALSLGVELGNKVAFRCNFVSVEDGVLADFTAGHISTDEARKLVKALNSEFSQEGRFFTGLGYRHLFVCGYGEGVRTTPPHDIVGERIQGYLPEGGGDAERLRELMLRSKEVLEAHEVNLRRAEAGKRRANMIWLWGQGRKPSMKPFRSIYGVEGAVISAVDLVKGIGVAAGMRRVEVPGATGYYDTNYEGKAEHALAALEEVEYCYVHVEAPDEAGHEGDAELKVRCIEELDRRLLGRVLDGCGEEVAVAVLPDHPTPVRVRTHTSDPVPVAVLHPGLRDDVRCFSERACAKGGLGMMQAKELNHLLLRHR